VRKGTGQIETGWTRRRFLTATLGGGALFASGLGLFQGLKGRNIRADVFIAKVPDYSRDIAGAIRGGLRELGVRLEEIKGKRILLKPNLVETHLGHSHINTHPLVVRGAIEAFKGLGAGEVLVAEGPGHCRDSFLLVEESGLSEVLAEDRIRFVDLNYDDVFAVPNRTGYTRLEEFILPKTLKEVDWVVSMPKMKTHHWAGVTLSMKNMFGVMPGSYYGWPKNVLHIAGIQKAILDINATVVPNLAIVDGIVGMEGDGPIMGDPRPAGTLVIGGDFPAVDATCARIMSLNPEKVPYLEAADGRIGAIREKNITQRGETIKSVETRFALIDKIPAHRGLRLQVCAG
jgi:uncharacterized protein (DUF362 family)